MKIKIGLSEKNCDGSVKILNRLLADESRFQRTPQIFRIPIPCRQDDDQKSADEKYGDMGTSDFLTGLMANSVSASAPERPAARRSAKRALFFILPNFLEEAFPAGAHLVKVIVARVFDVVFLVVFLGRVEF